MYRTDIPPPPPREPKPPTAHAVIKAMPVGSSAAFPMHRSGDSGNVVATAIGRLMRDKSREYRLGFDTDERGVLIAQRVWRTR